MKQIKYEVTDVFGISAMGEIRRAYLLIEGDGDIECALLYHPKDIGCCASIEFCSKNNRGYYVTCTNHEAAYINIDGQGPLNQLIKSLTHISYRNTKAEVFSDE